MMWYKDVSVMNVCTLTILLIRLLMLNFHMLLLLLRNIMSSLRIIKKKSCHSENSEEVHVQWLLGRGLLRQYTNAIIV